MDKAQVPAVSARRRARVGLAVALTASAGLSVLGGTLQHSDADDRLMGKLLVGLASVLLITLPHHDKGVWVRLDHGLRYLTAQTISGWRTVDLHRLARVGVYEVLSHHAAANKLVLIDLDGVRLMVDDEQVDRATKIALANHRTDALRISGNARHRLGVTEPAENFRDWSLPGSSAIVFLLVPLCFGPPVLLAWAAYLVSAM